MVHREIAKNIQTVSAGGSSVQIYYFTSVFVHACAYDAHSKASAEDFYH